MLFLIRGCTFSTCRYYKNVVYHLKLFESCPLFRNLNFKRPSICKLFSTEPNLLTNASVRKYLDRLLRVYKNESQEEIELFSEILKLQTVPVLLDKKIEIIENMKSLDNLAREGEEMKKLAIEEGLICHQKLLDIDQQMLDIIGHNLGIQNYENVIVEIVPGVGGIEAKLFAEDLLTMYIGYLNYLGFKHDVVELKRESSGLRKASILVSDSRAFEKLKYEGGVHRVQRVPTTERSGRMHTSTAVVTISPEPSEIDISLPEKDLKIETKRASGAGGQHVNTTDSAVRIVHIPTGKSISCQMGRSQLENRKLALMMLRSLLYQEQLEKQTTFIEEIRKKQMGTKLRNEKIRTYNFNQNRVTDHRISNGTRYNIKGFITDGASLAELEEKLYKELQQQTLLEMIEKTENRLK